jgi:hypothetical protein
MQSEEIFNLKDLSDAGYQAILDFALFHCSHFSFVRQPFAFNENLGRVVDSLKPFRLMDKLTDEWPGTKLLDSLAFSYEFEITEESIGILRKAKSLVSWTPSDFPVVDLAFYTSENRPWLYTISHESFFFIDKGALPNVDHSELLRMLYPNAAGLDR